MRAVYAPFSGRQNLNNIMGQQLRARVKRRRRKNYLVRKKELAKTGLVRKNARSKSAAIAEAKAPAKKVATKKAPVKKTPKAEAPVAAVEEVIAPVEVVETEAVVTPEVEEVAAEEVAPAAEEVAPATEETAEG
jgi:hypothetical protein